MITNGVNYSELNTDIYYLSSYWVNIAIKTYCKHDFLSHCLTYKWYPIYKE